MKNINEGNIKIIIPRYISDKVVTISPAYKGINTGGVSVFVNTLSGYYENFNHIVTTRSGWKAFKFFDLIFAIVKLFYCRFIKKIKIAHIHGASYISFFRKMIIINFCYILKMTIVYHIHGAEFKIFYSKYNFCGIIKRTLEKVSILLVLSNSWRYYFATIINENKILVLNNVVINPNINKCYFNDPIIVKYIFLGLIGERKGIFDLLEVISNHRKLLKDKFILYIGGNGQVNKLVNYIEEYRIKDLVVFKGFVSGLEKEELLSMCDIFVLPSYNEGLPISILEAMSYGMPIISTAVGGIPEIIINNENGFLIKPGDKNSLFSSILYFIEKGREIKRMGSKNLERIHDFYPEKVIPELNIIYKKLLDLSNEL
jgi:glycosyltransferase involved in cell wall biosynthesis